MQLAPGLLQAYAQEFPLRAFYPQTSWVYQANLVSRRIPLRDDAACHALTEGPPAVVHPRLTQPQPSYTHRVLLRKFCILRGFRVGPLFLLFCASTLLGLPF